MKIFSEKMEGQTQRPWQAIPLLLIIIAITVWAGLQATIPLAGASPAAEGDFYIWLPIILVAEEPEPSIVCYQEVEGRVVGEIEDAPLSEEWASETALEGYTGSSYYTWRGPNLHVTPGVGVLSYEIEISTPGEYLMRIRNRHDNPDWTEENDVFTRMNHSDWVKTYSWQGGRWTYVTSFEFPDHTHDHSPRYQLGAGRHLFEISARSHGYSLDRFVLYRTGGPSAEDPNLPVSPPCN